MSHSHRNFILGGYVREEPVLVTAQGTYGVLAWQGWNGDLSPRWSSRVEGHEPGARGSHMCPVVDINGDGVDEFFWGERCIEMDTGKELFCADRDVYKGHSDVIQPVWDEKSNRWIIYTAREFAGYSPRVVAFDDKGERMWSDLEEGHMDLGWVARIGDNQGRVAMAIRVGSKSAGSKGLFHKGIEQFSYNAFTVEKIDLGYSVYKSVPVDMSGDGYHEIVRGQEENKGEILDRKGNVLADIGSRAVICCKFMDMPGEQVLSYTSDGTLRIWADLDAEDSDEALARYANPFYELNQRLTATGSNPVNLGGI